VTEPLYTTAEVARLLDVTEGRVRQLARAHHLGRTLSPRVRVFTTADVAAMRHERRPGRGRKKMPRPGS